MKAVLAALLLVVLIAALVWATQDRPAVAPAPSGLSAQPDAAAAPPGPGGFNPLRSDAVKDAIHRALRTGETQRWADAGLSGYAVPSATQMANGCRAVRYTIDQQPEVPYRSITACE